MVQNLYIPENEQDQTPEVLFHAGKGELSMKGHCNPIEIGTDEFFEPIMDWLAIYLAEPRGDILFVYEMGFVHDIPNRRMQTLFQKLSEYHNNQKGNVIFELRYEWGDTDALEDFEYHTEGMKCACRIVPI